MYRDLLNQIIKYIKRSEEYYLFFEFFISTEKDPCYCHLYLIYTVDNEIRMKRSLGSIYLNTNIIEVNDLLIGNNRVLYFEYKDSDSNIQNYRCLPYYIYIPNGTIELYIRTLNDICIYYCWDIKYDMQRKIQNHSKIFNRIINSEGECHKINEKSISLINDGIKTLRRISKLEDIRNIKDMNFSKKEKKFVKINYYDVNGFYFPLFREDAISLKKK